MADRLDLRLVVDLEGVLLDSLSKVALQRKPVTRAVALRGGAHAEAVAALVLGEVDGAIRDLEHHVGEFAVDHAHPAIQQPDLALPADRTLEREERRTACHG